MKRQPPPPTLQPTGQPTSPRVFWTLLLLSLLTLPWTAGCQRRSSPQSARTSRLQDSPLPATTGPTSPATGEIEGLVCFDCHTPLADERQLGIAFSHARHADRGTHCQSCHGTYDHQPLPPGTPPHTLGISADCLRCHDGQIADNNCRTCHLDTQKILPAEHREPGFGRNHGRADQTSCLQCHTQSSCADCHGLELPHSEAFTRDHGPSAKQNLSLCYTCHQPQTCDQCHGLTLPHPPEFKASHGKTNQRLCAQCHTANDCRTCHTQKNPHPANFKTTHGGAAQAEPQRCATCHTPSQCSSCHGLTMPHPLRFATLHGQAARQNPQLCNRCHTQQECRDCHGTDMPHPSTFLAEHGAKAKINGSNCGQCHQPNDCQSCHGVEMPHPPGYALNGHQGEARFGSGSVCARCHTESYCAICHTANPGATATTTR